MNKILELEFITSIITIVLVVLTLAIFIKYGASILFYVLVIITFAVGFFNAWLISTIDRRKGGAEPARARKTQRRAKRR